MKKRIVVSLSKDRPVEKKDVEIVERKGLGHPDTICDGVAEAASRALSRFYLKNFRRVYHHNLDKGLLVAGRSRPSFSGGKVIDPISIIIAGRATGEINNRIIGVQKIVVDAAKEYIAENLKMDPKNVNISTRISSGSASLTDVVDNHVSNDTSFGVGYAPLSRTDSLVLKLDSILRSASFRKRFPFVGDDVKIMAVRRKRSVSMNLAAAFIDSYFKDGKAYSRKKRVVKQELERRLGVPVTINSLDDSSPKTVDDCYLTVTGSSAEMGDDGVTGRGNRVNGLITPMRPMSFEASAGKNPVSHVGKLYNIIAFMMADDIVKALKVKEAHVFILSNIGDKLDEPELVSVELFSSKLDDKMKSTIELITKRHLGSIPALTKEIIAGKVRLF